MSEPVRGANHGWGFDATAADAGAEAVEARSFTGDGGPDVPSTTDDRLAERLDPNRHHPGQPDGLATTLQPGGVIPGGGPGATQGSLGTGGGSTGGADTGDVPRGGV